jgi:hypothetical protein
MKHAALRRATEQLGDPEVEDLEAAFPALGVAEKQVLRLDVAVKDPGPMSRAEPVQELASERDGLDDREAPPIAPSPSFFTGS